MAKKVGVFAGKGVGRDPSDRIKTTLYITRGEHRDLKRALFELEERGLSISISGFARSAIRAAIKRAKQASSFSTVEDFLEFLEK